MKKELRDVRVHDDIMSYAVEIARNTRKKQISHPGCQPQGRHRSRPGRQKPGLPGRPQLHHAGGRSRPAQPVLLHRLILSAQARLEGKKRKDVLQEAMRAAKVPVL